MKRCTKCGSMIDDEDRFCTYCGAEQTTKNDQEGSNSYCPHCGTKIDPNDDFCPVCGMEVEKNKKEESYVHEDGTNNNDESSYSHQYSDFGGYQYNYNQNSVRPVSPFTAYGRFWKKAFDYKGKSTRSEYWWPYLLNSLFSSVIMSFIENIKGPIVQFELLGETYQFYLIYVVAYILLTIAIFIPDLACMVRRIRDTGKSPYNIFKILIPIAGPIMVFIMLLMPTDRYGHQE